MIEDYRTDDPRRQCQKYCSAQLSSIDDKTKKERMLDWIIETYCYSLNEINWFSLHVQYPTIIAYMNLLVVAYSTCKELSHIIFIEFSLTRYRVVLWFHCVEHGNMFGKYDGTSDCRRENFPCHISYQRQLQTDVKTIELDSTLNSGPDWALELFGTLKFNLATTA